MDGFEKIYTGDFNGDGKTDIIQRRKHNSNYTNYFVYYSTGNGFTYGGGPAFYTVNNRSSELLVGEFNGDGVFDAIIYYPGAKDYYTFSSEYIGGQLRPLQEKSVRHLPINWDRVEQGDFNGDGLTDFINLDDNGYVILQSDGYGTISNSLSGSWPHKGHTISVGDFNGDGKTDLLMTGWNNMEWGDWVIRYSKGNGFEQIRIPKRFDTYTRRIFTGDLNGDGKDDLITVDKTNAQGNLVPMQLYIKTSDTDFAYQQGINVYPTDKWSFYSGDFNGDGRVDFLCKSNFSYIDTYGSQITGFSGYQLYSSITDRDRLLKKATDSYGNTTEFSYKPLTNKEVYTAQTNSSYPVSDFTAPLYVVDKMTQPDGIGGTRTTNYRYAGAKLHKRGKGLLGFSKFTATDEKTGVSSIAIYDYDPIKYVMGLKRAETRITKGGYNNFLLSEVNYTNTYREYNGYHFVPIYTYQPTRIEEKNYELGSTSPYKTSVTSCTYDDYGNVLTTEQSFGTEATIRSVNQYYPVNTAQWYLGRLEKTSVIKQTPGQPDIVRTSKFEYNPTSGLLTKEIMEPNNALLGFSKTYEHDNFGNAIKTTITTNEKSIVKRVVYDSRGRFVIESYNALNQKTVKQTHPIYGTLTSVTDINGLTATKNYDAFGRERLTTGPDGSKSVTALRWCRNVDNAPANALWFKYVEASGSPGTMVFYDKMKREVRTATTGFDGKMIFVDTEYNALGQVSRQSEPYFKNETPVWSELTYDVLGRMTQKKLPDASLIKITYNGLTITTENALGQKNTKRTNMQGLLVESKDNAQKSVTYTYNSTGNPVEVRNSKGSVITMEYDLIGNRTKLIDPDLGTIVSRFNAFGELVYEKDANSNESTFEYDVLGRMTLRTEKEGTTTWTYDTKENGKGKLASISGPDGYAQEIKYDNLGRVIEAKEKIAGTEYITSTVYDSYGRVLKINYPSVRGEKFTVWNKYNAYGYLLSP